MIPEEVRARMKTESECVCDPLQVQCDLENQTKGELKGVACNVCSDKGYILKPINGEIQYVVCSCKEQRESLRRI